MSQSYVPHNAPNRVALNQSAIRSLFGQLKRGSLVVSALTFSARGHGFDPRAGEEIVRCPNMLSIVSFAGMTLKK